MGRVGEVNYIKSEKGKQLLLLSVATIGVILVFKYALAWFIPFLFAYFIAWIARPIVDCLAIRFRIPRTVSCIITIFLFLTVIIGLLIYLFQALLNQVRILFINIPVYQEMLLGQINNICQWGEGLLGLHSGAIQELFYEKMDSFIAVVQVNLFPEIQEYVWGILLTIIKILGVFVITFIASVLILKDFKEYKESFQKSTFYSEIHAITGRLSNAGIAYLKAQLIIICIIATIISLGLFLIGNRYALLFGIGIALMDAFPVLGSGIVLIPWGVILILSKDFVQGAIILTIYLACQLTRQFLEPKLVGDSIGIQPIYTLISMYVGIKIYGVIGFFLGPISLVIIMAVMKAFEEK